jgi:hypothetical protein
MLAHNCTSIKKYSNRLLEKVLCDEPERERENLLFKLTGWEEKSSRKPVFRDSGIPLRLEVRSIVTLSPSPKVSHSFQFLKEDKLRMLIDQKEHT